MAQQYTRNKICDVFIHMLNQRPLSKITVKEVVAECGINRNTFYYYYANLYEVLTELFQLELEKVIKGYNDTLSWEESFLVAADFALKNKKAIYHVYNSIQREELETYLYHTAGNVMKRYVERIANGMPVSEEDKLLISTFYQSALTQMLLHWIHSGMKEEPVQMIRRIGFLFDGNIALSLQRAVNETIIKKEVQSSR